jgi:sec-independent protein translocase protein TatB
MSPGIGMPELMVVLVLALVVVGPRQLPVMMRKVGQIMAQARAMAKEFQQSFEEIGRETELAELRKEIEALKKSNPVEEIRGEVDKVAYEARFGSQGEAADKPAAGTRSDKPHSLPERGDG